MGFRRDKPIVMKYSASAMNNNLSVQIDLSKNVINYAVIHKSVVNLISASTDGSLVHHRQITCKEPTATMHGNTVVFQARLVNTSGRTILVMTSQKGIQMFEADMSVMLYWYALGDSTAAAECSFGRGICGVSGKIICVGTSEGSILVFDIPERGTNITLSQEVKAHSHPLCTLESQDDVLVSSSDNGDIKVWKEVSGSIEEVIKIGGTGYPCCSLALHDNMIVAGFASGHVRVYEQQSGCLLCEADAHSRTVTSVDVASGSGIVLSASEDTFVRVWQLLSSGELVHKHSEHVPDLQIQGAKFIGKDGRAFGCTGYDSNEILFYTEV